MDAGVTDRQNCEKKQLKTENLYLLKAEVCDNMNIRGIRPGKFSLLLRTVRARDQKEVKT